jgi:PAS domain S-box-containing protein
MKPPRIPPPEAHPSSELLLAVLDQAPEAVLLADQGGRLRYVNPAACALLGRSAEDLKAGGLQLLRPELPFAAWVTPTVETHLITPDGRRVPVEILRREVGAGEERLLALRIRDLRERRAVEAALHRSESRYALAFNASPDAIVLSSLEDGAYLEVNEGFERLLGWKRSEAVGRTPAELGVWDTPEERRRLGALLREKGEFDGALFTYRSRDGRILRGLTSARMVSLEGLPSVLTVTRDVTAQMEAQRTVGNLTDLLSAITASVPAFIALLDREGRFRFLNRVPAGGSMEESLGRDFLEILGPEVREAAALALARVLMGSEREEFEGWALGGSQEPRWYRHVMGPMAENGKVAGAVLASMDETQAHRMEEALRQSQKLEGLGVLAGGIAHDFNNLLTAIMGNLNLAQLKLPEGSPALTHLEAVENTVLKASGLTRQMLAYSGKGRFKVKPQNLSVLVRDIEHLMRATVSGRGALELDLAGELPSVEGDAAQIQQVVMNLVTNAAEAFGDRPGTLRVATARVDLDEDRLRREFPAQSLDPGPHVMLEVEDTGQGMAPEVLARIFDPFFSTKVRGRGLGLSALMGILRGHRAGIRVRSAPGQGSLFQVLFPATDAPALAAPGAVPVPEAALRGRVLLVDDEPVILDSMGAALENMGFEVVPAHDGVEALERFQEGRPDLVIMDLTMPRMDGATAFGRMQELDPRVPVILSSGYDRQALEGARPAAFVQKPYRFQELKDLVREVMAAR